MSLVSSQTSIIVQKNQKNNNMNGTENDGTEDEDYEEIKELDDDEEELNHHQLKLEEPDIPIREVVIPSLSFHFFSCFRGIISTVL